MLKTGSCTGTSSKQNAACGSGPDCDGVVSCNKQEMGGYISACMVVKPNMFLTPGGSK